MKSNYHLKSTIIRERTYRRIYKQEASTRNNTRGTERTEISARLNGKSSRGEKANGIIVDIQSWCVIFKHRVSQTLTLQKNEKVFLFKRFSFERNCFDKSFLDLSKWLTGYPCSFKISVYVISVRTDSLWSFSMIQRDT